MKLENQVVSLELAKKLKKLGVKQESVWVWAIGGDKCEDKWTLLLRDDDSWSATEVISAFTCAELGEMLPEDILCFKHQDGKGFFIRHRTKEIYFVEDNEANARAKMLIYLIKNKLIEL